MTSAHSMPPGRSRPNRVRTARSRLRLSALILFLSLMAVVLVACSSRERLTQPVQLSSPYERPQVWAIAPFNNESGVSIVKTDRIADVFVEQAEEVNGLSAVPVNRVMAAMQRLNLRSIASHQEAMALMNALNVDGLIIGTITAYDPYRPLKLGAAVQLYRRDANSQASTVDPTQLTRATTDITQATPNAPRPIARASGVFDASNHQVLKWLDEFAKGRAEPSSAYGPRIYLASMEMYTQFVAYRLLHDLLAIERASQEQMMAAQPK